MKLRNKIKTMKFHSKVILTIECAIDATIIGYSLLTNSFGILTLIYAGLPVWIGTTLWVGIEYCENGKKSNKHICLEDVPDEVKCKAPSYDKSNVKQDVYVVPYDKMGYPAAHTQNRNIVKVRKRTREDSN